MARHSRKKPRELDQWVVLFIMTALLAIIILLVEALP